MPTKRKYNYRPEEQQILESLKKRNKVKPTAMAPLKEPVSYWKQGNFSIAIVKTSAGEMFGVSKRNPSDSFNPKVGCQVAFVRAISYG